VSISFLKLFEFFLILYSFNMAVRSASAMIIPMLEFQALQFRDGGLHHAKIDAERSMYAEIQRRLDELHESATLREEPVDTFYAGTSAFPNNPLSENNSPLGSNSRSAAGDWAKRNPLLNPSAKEPQSEKSDGYESSGDSESHDLGGFAGKFNFAHPMSPLQINAKNSFSNMYS
jgi:hypothetical protein